MTQAVPEEVRRFVRARIRSVGELEVLLLLHRDPNRWWNADQVNSELRSSLQSALQCLDALLRAGLAEEKDQDGRAFRFHRADAEAEAVVPQLAELFRDRMAAIVEIIYSPQRDSIREFADAFRLSKKGGKDDG
jgi:hypothetical protein